MSNNFIVLSTIPEVKQSNNGLSYLLTSIICHIIIFIFLIINIPYQKNLPESKEIVVEVMKIANKSNLLAKQSEANLKEPPKEVKSSEATQTKKEESKLPDSPKIAPPQIDHEQHKSEKPPEKKVKKNALQPPKVPELKKDEPKKAEPKKEKKSKNKNNLDSLLKSLEKSVSNKKVENKTNNYSKLLDQELNDKSLSITLQQDIQRQLYACWNPPAGAKNAQNMAVSVRIELDIDGKVISTKQIGNEMNIDPAYAAAVNAAIRAVGKCSPLQNLPKEEYNSWKVLEFNFDPRNIIY